ncbi:MAG: cysteine--tRNA ligase [Methanobacteriota archaeon]|nr:MAG: cysteine--tRNA ligase [Euryarchaeota archaeon]
MALVIYNTMTKRKEPFEPLEKGKVSVYVCGVTAYDKSHLGHARSAINFDVIVRYLRSKGYDVRHITNFTDVDDKLIARAHELDVDPMDLSRQMIDEYFSVMDGLKIRRATAYPKASETISDIIEMVKGLMDKGLAYESGGSVYFIVRKVKDYGKLSGQSLDQMVTGTRKEPGEDKRDPMDFALWKAAKPGEVSWDSPWGKGRPGWHIECSAMCLKHLGKTIDIHGGGTDLIFPHHENEILQSEAHNEAPFVRYWMHNGMLTMGEEKMSKSMKNFFLVDEVLRRYSPEVVRFFILNASYRQPLDYGEGSLDEAGRALEKLQETYTTLLSEEVSADGTQGMEEACNDAWARLTEAMDDDFSTREAIAVMFELSRKANRGLAEGSLNRAGVGSIISVFRRFNDLFDVLREEKRRVVAAPEDTRPTDTAAPDDTLTIDASRMSDDGYVTDLVRKREIARRRREFDCADKIRELLAEHGIEIQDTPEGAVWKRR